MSNLLIWMIKDCAESKLFWWFKEGATHFSDFPVAADLLQTVANVAPGWNEQTSHPLPYTGFGLTKRFRKK